MRGPARCARHALEFARSLTAAGMVLIQSFVLQSGEVVATLPVPRSGQPIHVLSPAGGIVRSFGSPDTAASARCRACPAPLIAPSAARDQLWATPVVEYSLSLWNGRGREVRRVVVEHSPWYDPRDPNVLVPPGASLERPHAMFRSIAEAADGQLWVLGTAAARNWTPPPPASVPARGSARGFVPLSQARPNPELLKRTASVIEVLDPARGRVVVTQRFEGRSIRLLSAALAYEIREDPDGFAIVDVFRVRIVDAGRR